MNVVAFNGSPHPHGNTAAAIKLVAAELERENISVEIVQVGSQLIHGCIACGGCARNLDERCVLGGDNVNAWIQKMKAADGIIIGSPVYYSAIAGTMKAFLDRAFFVTGVNGGLLRHKVGAAVAAVRRSGGMPTFDQLNHYLSISEMIVPSANYWNVIHGTEPGEAVQDGEGVQVMQVLGQNMAWLLKLIEFGRDKIAPPPPQEKVMTNFIR